MSISNEEKYQWGLKYQNRLRRETIQMFIPPIEELFGCSPLEFTNKIIEKLPPGMTLAQYGNFHIDHIIPRAIFANNWISKLFKEFILKKIHHFSNLQPLEGCKNLKKGNRVEVPMYYNEKTAPIFETLSEIQPPPFPSSIDLSEWDRGNNIQSKSEEEEEMPPDCGEIAPIDFYENDWKVGSHLVDYESYHVPPDEKDEFDLAFENMINNIEGLA